MGCADTNSEFDCMSKLGQGAGEKVFQSHWKSWITEADFDEMAGYELNTVRIPIDYWMNKTLVYSSSEHFLRGGSDALKSICGWAADKGFFVILDLHGAPGAQVSKNADTVQYAPYPGFYQDYQYDRATSFLAWLRQELHDNEEFRNVGMIEVVNEPEQTQGSETQTMREKYYPAAFKAIRDKETALGIKANDYIHVMFMNSKWRDADSHQAGDPTQYLPKGYQMAAFDDHRYLKWAPDASDVSHSGYIKTFCHDDRNTAGQMTVVGEFCLSVPDKVQTTSDWDPSKNVAFYKQWFEAQVSSYEAHTKGWVFWTWKANLNDERWSYKDAVAAGIIPKDLASIANSEACSGQ